KYKPCGTFLHYSTVKLPGIFLSLTRQILFFMPFLLILPRYMGIDGCIYAGPIADAMSAVVTVIMAYMEFKKMPRTEAEK
ncbi:MAG: MATE family efflux transporter, partial [Eubacteriales bacterium]|nr:MATE family efflux transporter [Eubacteriales bacterium]